MPSLLCLPSICTIELGLRTSSFVGGRRMNQVNQLRWCVWEGWCSCLADYAAQLCAQDFNVFLSVENSDRGGRRIHFQRD